MEEKAKTRPRRPPPEMTVEADEKRCDDKTKRCRRNQQMNEAWKKTQKSATIE